MIVNIVHIVAIVLHAIRNIIVNMEIADGIALMTIDFMPVTSRVSFICKHCKLIPDRQHIRWTHIPHWVDVEGFTENRYRPEYSNFHWPCRKGEDENVEEGNH